MSRMISTTIMITQLEGLLGTSDLRPHEIEFVKGLAHRKDAGEVTELSERQVNWLTDIWRKHFA